MIPRITINQIDLIMLANKPTLLDTYVGLLTMIGDGWCIKFRNFESLAKPLGFKTKSGIWKVLKKLERMELIAVLPNKIYIRRRGIYAK